MKTYLVAIISERDITVPYDVENGTVDNGVVKAIKEKFIRGVEIMGDSYVGDIADTFSGAIVIEKPIQADKDIKAIYSRAKKVYKSDKYDVLLLDMFDVQEFYQKLSKKFKAIFI